MMRRLHKIYRWFQNRPRFSKILVFVLVFVVIVIILRYQSNNERRLQAVSAETFQQQQQQLEREPFNGPLLLQTARHSYYLVRNSLLEDNAEPEELQAILEQGLGFYRRIIGHPSWQMQPRDYFYSAYLYYQLGSCYDYSLKYTYSLQARRMALAAYENGYRSPHLIALLANIHYESSDYDEAIGYFDSLGNSVKDPVLLLNKARALLARGGQDDFDRARQILSEIENSLGSYEKERPVLQDHYQRTRIRLALATGEYDLARRLILAKEDWRDNVNYQLLYAEYLLETGRKDESLTLLKKIKETGNYPPRVDNLLESFS
ncbi:MAG: tetratricopeptide repeat protein [bacterium]